MPALRQTFLIVSDVDGEEDRNMNDFYLETMDGNHTLQVREQRDRESERGGKQREE